jgi:ATP-dependent Clp protease ATP-binding subunit ClpA
VIDETGASQMLLPESRRKKSIGVKEIEATVATMARIPPKTVSKDDAEVLANLETMLKRVVYGQDRAIDALTSSIKLARAGLRDAEKPIGAYLFAGPTGVGKTEVAKQLASTLGVELLRFDMSEYMERHTVSRLIGAPPGYVGFDQGGLLTDGIDQHPHCVLLLDEIEKAHPDLFNILLQVMDHGKLTDHNGKQVDFRNVIIIMTTNAGVTERSVPPFVPVPTPVSFPSRSTRRCAVLLRYGVRRRASRSSGAQRFEGDAHLLREVRVIGRCPGPQRRAFEEVEQEGGQGGGGPGTGDLA